MKNRDLLNILNTLPKNYSLNYLFKHDEFDLSYHLCAFPFTISYNKESNTVHISNKRGKYTSILLIGDLIKVLKDTDPNADVVFETYINVGKDSETLITVDEYYIKMSEINDDPKGKYVTIHIIGCLNI